MKNLIYKFFLYITETDEKGELKFLMNWLPLIVLLFLVTLINYYINFYISLIFIGLIWFLNKGTAYFLLAIGFLFGAFKI